MAESNERVGQALVALAFVVLFAANAGTLLDGHVVSAGMVSWLSEGRALFGATERAVLDSEAFAAGAFGGAGLAARAPGWLLAMAPAWLLGLDPVVYSKVLAWPVAAGTVALLWRVGMRMGGATVATVACLLFLHAPVFRAVGIPKVFAWPVLLLFVLAQLDGSDRRRQTWLVLSAVFYAPVAPILAALMAWDLCWDAGWQRPDGARLRSFGAALAVVAIIAGVLPAIASSSPDLVSYEEALEREAPMDSGDLPGFDEGLYGPSLRTFLPVYWTGHAVTAALQPAHPTGWMPPGLDSETWRLRLAPAGVFAALLALLLFAPRAWLVPHPLLGRLVGAGVALYLLAVVVAFHLFWPDRYLRYPVALASILWVASVVARATAGRRGWLVGLGAAYLLLLGTGVRATVGPADDLRADAGVLAFLAATPAGSRVAGPMHLMDAVELLADRHTYLACQEADNLQLFDGPLFEHSRRRAAVWIEARYGGGLAAFAAREGVTHVVVEQGEPAEPCLGWHEEYARQVVAASAGRRGAESGTLVYRDERWAVLAF